MDGIIPTEDQGIGPSRETDRQMIERLSGEAAKGKVNLDRFKETCGDRPLDASIADFRIEEGGAGIGLAGLFKPRPAPPPPPPPMTPEQLEGRARDFMQGHQAFVDGFHRQEERRGVRFW